MNPVRFHSSAFAFAIAIAAALTALAGGASAQSQSSTITINGCASLTPNGGTTFTCVPSTTTTNPGAPAGCAATAAPASIPAGGALVTLGVTGCTAQTTDGSTTYTWSKSQGAISGVANAAAGSDTPVANLLTTAITITYTVAACNGSACNSFQAPGVQQTGTGVVPPPGTTIACTAANTINPPTGAVSFTATRTIDFGWGPVGAAQHLHTQDFGGFGPGEALVLTFRTPATLGANNATGNIGWSPDVTGAGSESQLRNIATLSNLPCDFSYNPIGSGSTRLGVSTGVNWSIGPNTLGVPALLSPNTTYYVNIRHYEECPLSHCNLQVDFTKPSGF